MFTYTEIEVCIEEFKGTFFIHGAHSKFLPLVTNAHSTQLDGRDAHTGEG